MRSSTTWLYGAGAHGKDIQAIWHAVHPKHRLNLADDSPQVQNHQLGIYPRSAIPHGADVILGAYYHREQISHPGRIAKPLVHPEAMVGGDGSVDLGRGVVIARGAVIDQSVKLGQHVHVNYGASMTRCVIEDFCTISPGVVIAGDVHIGRATFVGAGAVISNLVTIGRGCTIGAGAVVLEDVPEGVTVVGNPARPISIKGESSERTY